MAMQEKQLGQLRPANTSAASIYQVPASTTAIISRVEIQNVTAGAETFSIFHDADGSTYSEATALFFESPIAAKGHVAIDCHWAANNSSGNFAVKSSTGNAITFTFYGVEIS